MGWCCIAPIGALDLAVGSPDRFCEGCGAMEPWGCDRQSRCIAPVGALDLAGISQIFEDFLAAGSAGRGGLSMPAVAAEGSLQTRPEAIPGISRRR